MDGKADIYSRSPGISRMSQPTFYRRLKSASDKTAAPGCVSLGYFAGRNVLARDPDS
jgi:hypothetical protein